MLLQHLSPQYQAFGVRDKGGYKQLNANILQIEAEYYSDIRPKRVTLAGERPIHALQNRGIEYIELRGIDINPYHSVGLSADDILFLELYLFYCLLQQSPPIDAKTQEEIRHNQTLITTKGRELKLTLSRNGQSISIAKWLKKSCKDLCLQQTT